MLGSPLRPFLYKETIIVCLSFFRNSPFRTTMPIAQDKLSKFGINLRGECQLCFFTVSNPVVLYQTWAIKCSTPMLSKSHEILKKTFLILPLSPFLLSNGAEIHCVASGYSPLGSLFFGPIPKWVVLINFRRFLFPVGNAKITFGLWQQNCHEANFPLWLIF